MEITITNKVEAIKAIRNNQHIEIKDVTGPEGQVYKAMVLRSSLYDDKKLVEAIMAFGVKRYFDDYFSKKYGRSEDYVHLTDETDSDN